MINCKSSHHGVKFWQLVASGNNIRCCWHCVVKASLPLHWPNCLVQFTRTEHNRKWAQLVCQNSPSVHVLLAFKLFLGMIKPVSMLPFCMYAANYSSLTSSLVPSVSAVSSVMWQECGLPCARFKGLRPVLEGFVVPMHEGACETGSQIPRA